MQNVLFIHLGKLVEPLMCLVSFFTCHQFPSGMNLVPHPGSFLQRIGVQETGSWFWLYDAWLHSLGQTHDFSALWLSMKDLRQRHQSLEELIRNFSQQNSGEYCLCSDLSLLETISLFMGLAPQVFCYYHGAVCFMWGPHAMILRAYSW